MASLLHLEVVRGCLPPREQLRPVQSRQQCLDIMQGKALVVAAVGTAALTVGLCTPTNAPSP